ncbi:MAG: phosphohydrolase, partial [Ruminococcus sp.]|nr:phosphohydrolase [Ruminococcus sp.]
LLDRLQPIILNYSKNGISWKEHAVKAVQVKERTKNFSEISEELSQLINAIINDATGKGYLNT